MQRGYLMHPKNQPVGPFLNSNLLLHLGHGIFSPTPTGIPGAASRWVLFSISIIFSIHFAEHKLVWWLVASSLWLVIGFLQWLQKISLNGSKIILFRSSKK